MEGGDIYRASNSLRVRSSTVRRNSGVDVFSKSTREEDDEEALKWAALEKLPTFNRLKKGLLTTSHGVANEIDVTNLGFQERQRLLDKFVKVAEEDNGKFLLKVGLDVPTIEVRYQHLNIQAQAFVGRISEFSPYYSKQKETGDYS
ncbi:pleiotropic drug resistance protein 1-like [Cajanus cajan]|uniref:pleiotropic drug resistance protein 1-like n=1 Tax=Cajanus cajan TaxID=3821 RepID=UPI0010FB4D30|nr:pleiotropic drug resistance protein 1-like [Cajanus cajan]